MEFEQFKGELTERLKEGFARANDGRPLVEVSLTQVESSMLSRVTRLYSEGLKEELTALTSKTGEVSKEDNERMMTILVEAYTLDEIKRKFLVADPRN